MRDKILQVLSLVKPIKTEHELVRIGGNADGGYLIPDDLDGVECCFSPGVDKVATFEEDLAKRGIKSFMADYSVEHAPVDNPLFDFEKKFLGPSEKRSDIYMTLSDWVIRKAPRERGDFILQMDIEGAEYWVILDTNLELLRRFRVMAIEFHYLDRLADPGGCEHLRTVFSKLAEDFSVVHIHPNNNCVIVNCYGLLVPPVMEFTFLRHDRIKQRWGAESFPHPLDRNNVDNMPNLPLPECWYRGEPK